MPEERAFSRLKRRVSQNILISLFSLLLYIESVKLTKRNFADSVIELSEGENETIFLLGFLINIRGNE